MAQAPRAEHHPGELEPQPGAELHHAGAADGVGDLAEVGGRPADDVVRQRVVDGVEHVEHVPPQLEVRLCPERERLRQAEIDAALPEAAQDVAAQVAEALIARIAAGRRGRRASTALVERRLGRVVACWRSSSSEPQRLGRPKPRR